MRKNIHHISTRIISILILIINYFIKYIGVGVYRSSYVYKECRCETGMHSRLITNIRKNIEKESKLLINVKEIISFGSGYLLQDIRLYQILIKKNKIEKYYLYDEIYTNDFINHFDTGKKSLFESIKIDYPDVPLFLLINKI